MHDRPPNSQRSSTQLADALDCLAAAVAIGLLVVTLLDRQNAPRVLLALAFACFVPGRAIVSNWPRMADWSGAIIALVFSLSVLCLLAVITLWAHYWHPLGLFQVEAGVSLAGLALSVARRHQAPALVRRRLQRRPTVRALEQ